MKNQDTGHLFLNDEDELPETRVVIEKGVMWQYSNTEEKESVQTTGPLKYGVLLMVSLSTRQTKSNMLTLHLNRVQIGETTAYLCFCLLGAFPWRLKGDCVLQVHHPGWSQVLA